MNRNLSPFEQHYEALNSQPGSSRSFGWTFAAVFFMAGIWPVFKSYAPHWWLLGLALALVLVASLAPRWLTPLNRAWFRVGVTLNKVLSPVVMATPFFVVMTPAALLRRWTGSDVLGLRYMPEATSYWRRREKSGSGSDNLKNQF